MKQITAIIILPKNEVGEVVTLLNETQSRIQLDVGSKSQLDIQVTDYKSEARLLADAYYDLYPKENPAEHLRLNPNIDQDEFWDDISSTFQNWLDEFKENPNKAIAASNWKGKVTKAYFKLRGMLFPLHPDKKTLLRSLGISVW